MPHAKAAKGAKVDMECGGLTPLSRNEARLVGRSDPNQGGASSRAVQSGVETTAPLQSPNPDDTEVVPPGSNIPQRPETTDEENPVASLGNRLIRFGDRLWAARLRALRGSTWSAAA